MARTSLSLRGVAVTAAKVAIAVAAFAWLVGQIDVERALGALGGLQPGPIAALFAVSIAGLFARFYTWQVTIAPVQRVSVRTAGSIALIVNFVNQLLPSRLSGRLAAPFVLRSQTGMAYTDAAAVSGVHTGIYALLYGLVSLVGVAASYGQLPFGLVVVVGLSTGLYLAAGVFVLAVGTNLQFLDPLLAVLTRVVARVPRVGERAAERIRDLSSGTDASAATFRDLATNPRVWLGYAAGWAVTLVLAPGVRVFLLLASFGVAFEPVVLLPLYLVTAYSVTLLPLTPGGIGVTEATATAVFVALGVPAEVIVPIVLVDRVFGIYLPAVMGWYPSTRLDLAAMSVD
ncbi:lysylphosphatidylglycerol synthase transmembrane domain-containing protein [Halorientalis salina]|uniref:lysylphosphatidylglycerol synthase transmembrane domain-containing protein n=1 Tax=Halorientalis salina TaxID=2932266 RepID=UPI0010ACA912|nr:lysylphosphatidylglycerol synthase transmembrane domain-containing protein [Halorientalis salina]